MASGPITSLQIDGETVETVKDFILGVPSLYGKYMGKQWKQCRTLFLGAPKSLQMVTTAMKLKDLDPWKKSYDQPRQHIKKQRHYFANKSLSSQGYGFSSGHVWM